MGFLWLWYWNGKVSINTLHIQSTSGSLFLAYFLNAIDLISELILTIRRDIQCVNISSNNFHLPVLQSQKQSPILPLSEVVRILIEPALGLVLLRLRAVDARFDARLSPSDETSVPPGQSTQGHKRSDADQTRENDQLAPPFFSFSFRRLSRYFRQLFLS